MTNERLVGCGANIDLVQVKVDDERAVRGLLNLKSGMLSVVWDVGCCAIEVSLKISQSSIVHCALLDGQLVVELRGLVVDWYCLLSELNSFPLPVSFVLSMVLRPLTSLLTSMAPFLTAGSDGEYPMVPQIGSSRLSISSSLLALFLLLYSVPLYLHLLACDNAVERSMATFVLLLSRISPFLTLRHTPAR